jgi:hypothetical protein
LKCIVDIETLENSPFFLTANNNIVAKIRAINPQGPGAFSEVGYSVQMITSQVDAPQLTEHEKGPEEVQVCWTSVLNNNSLSRFEIYRNDESNPEEPVIFLGATSSTCYTISLTQVSVLRGTRFDASRPDLKYWVKATNGCAFEWSNGIVVETAEVPAKPAVFTSLSECNIKVKWS